MWGTRSSPSLLDPWPLTLRSLKPPLRGPQGDGEEQSQSHGIFWLHMFIVFRSYGFDVVRKSDIGIYEKINSLTRQQSFDPAGSRHIRHTVAFNHLCRHILVHWNLGKLRNDMV